MSERINIPGRIITTPPSQTGSLGEAIIQKLRRDSQAERAVTPPTLRSERKSDKPHTMRITRATNRIELFAPEGYLMAHGRFATAEELASNVAHFLSQHLTTVVYAD